MHVKRFAKNHFFHEKNPVRGGGGSLHAGTGTPLSCPSPT